jgi:aerobic carbon-monoxide dehydrogenase medium subunit
VKPPPLLWLRAESIDSALDGLARYGDEAKVIAGGQSLVPLLNFRLARPGVLVDVNRIRELSYVHAEDGTLTIGALTRQREIERSPVAARACPLLSQSMRHIGHAQIRNRGTVGGSLAHADPAAELPAVAVALDAEIVAARPGGERAIPAREFFVGPLMTVLEPDELVVAVRVRIRPGAKAAFREVARRAGDFALAGLAAEVELDARGTVEAASLAALGVGGTPVRLTAAEQALEGRELGAEAIEDAAGAAAAEVEPPADVFAEPAYRRQLVSTLVRRTLTELAERP